MPKTPHHSLSTFCTFDSLLTFPEVRQTSLTVFQGRRCLVLFNVCLVHISVAIIPPLPPLLMREWVRFLQ